MTRCEDDYRRKGLNTWRPSWCKDKRSKPFLQRWVQTWVEVPWTSLAGGWHRNYYFVAKMTMAGKSNRNQIIMMGPLRCGGKLITNPSHPPQWLGGDPPELTTTAIRWWWQPWAWAEGGRFWSYASNLIENFIQVKAKANQNFAHLREESTLVTREK